ncbi:hypothetical protein JOY44_26385 (plasmid) [Phormidium sp. CLA17]|uniref:hypothetical protein n=1 Tax=Leptolyngbya sp. Cla-17 TaxID=2803751 RepID=UPI0014920EE6|nr:hypothetical protein [Leptolyngbya sp. Cla-17]MBM0745049.1 hypothetical protein [Leptolyngbya sp. Cla-17]
MRQTTKPKTVENLDYLKGYRDGIRQGRMATRSRSGDGLLGALLAIALIAGVSYAGYSYATTGTAIPSGIDLRGLVSQSDSAQ